MRIVLILVMAVSISACGSFRTVGKTDREISSDLLSQKTYCETLPRVYSGLFYNFCCLHSNRQSVHVDWFQQFYLLDGVASAVVDTVLLPYTGYRQYKDGSVLIHSIKDL